MGCAVEDCQRPHVAGGYCELHYRRLRRTGTTDTPPPRFKPLCSHCGQFPRMSQTNPLCQYCHLTRVQQWRAVNEERTKELARQSALKSYRARRARVVAAYGGQCVDCGEKELAFLVIDHVNGSGREHRRSIGTSGPAFYRWLEKNNHPSGFAVCCHNCNWRRWLDMLAHMVTERDAEAQGVDRRKRAASARARSTILRARQEALARYGTCCACCGEEDSRVLTLDHVNGDGAAHRRKIGNGAGVLVWWLKAHDFPPGFQILCRNCNFAAGHGGCPHKELPSGQGKIHA